MKHIPLLLQTSLRSYVRKRLFIKKYYSFVLNLMFSLSHRIIETTKHGLLTETDCEDIMNKICVVQHSIQSSPPTITILRKTHYVLNNLSEKYGVMQIQDVFMKKDRFHHIPHFTYVNQHFHPISFHYKPNSNKDKEFIDCENVQTNKEDSSCMYYYNVNIHLL